MGDWVIVVIKKIEVFLIKKIEPRKEHQNSEAFHMDLEN